MKDSLYIKSRLDNLCVGFTSQDNNYQEDMINTIAWVYNFGNIRSQKEIQNRLDRAKEELITLEMFGDTDQIKLKHIRQKIRELENILQ